MSEMSAGEWLRRELAHRGISVRDATEAVGLKATQAVYAWLSDKAAPTDEAAKKLAGLLDVPEVEVRRRFGLWIPGDEETPPDLDRDRLREALRRFRQAADDLERLIDREP
jgi:transcriptional regulator with XRE-family HTH domain